MNVGVLLVLVGLTLLLAFGLYEGMRLLFTDSNAPLAVQVGIPLVIAGTLVALGKAFWDRRQAKLRTDRRIEEARP